MGVRIIEKKYFSQLKNGEDFSLNTGDFSVNFLGCTAEKLRHEATIEIFWNSKPAFTADMTITTTGTDRVITRTTGSWIQDGWKVNDTYWFKFGTGGTTGTGTVVYVQVDYIVITSLGSVNDVDFNFPSEIHGTTPLTGLFFSYGLPENSDPTSYTSHIDTSIQSYYSDGIIGAPLVFPARNTNTVTCEAVSGPQSWINGAVTVAFVSVTTNGLIQTFNVTQELLLLPYFLDGQLFNLQNIIEPDLYVNSDSLKHVSSYGFRSNINNPNTERSAVDDLMLGNIGWFNQSFNSQKATYSLNSITYSVGSTMGLASDGTTHVQISINSSDGTFTSSTVIMIGVSLLPSQDNYAPALIGNPSIEDFETIWLYDTKRQKSGEIPISSTIITDVSVGTVSANEILIDADITYTVAQQLKINPNDNYVIWVMVEDETLSNQNSNRVPIRVDVQEYQSDLDIPNLILFDEGSGFNRHDDTPVLSSLRKDFKGYGEDGFIYFAKFQLQTAQSAKIESFTARQVAYNDIDGAFFELDSFDVDLSTQVVVLGIQQFSVSYPRGFQLNPLDPMGNIILLNGSLDGTLQTYQSVLPFKWRWEKWTANSNADTVFYVAGTENDSLNMFTPHFIGNDYTLRLIFDFVISGTQPGGTAVSTTDYRFITEPCEILEFETDPYSPDNWSAIITLRDANGTDIGSNYITNGTTLIEVLYSWTGAGAFPLSELIFGVVRIDGFEGGIFSIQELSTNKLTLSGADIVPVLGETQLKKFVDTVSETVLFTCNIPPLGNAGGKRVSSEIYVSK